MFSEALFRIEKYSRNHQNVQPHGWISHGKVKALSTDLTELISFLSMISAD